MLKAHTPESPPGYSLPPLSLPTMPHGARILLAALVVLAAGCDAVGPVNEPPPEPPAEAAPLAALLRGVGSFDRFAELATEAGLSGGATTLAPDDEAFVLMSPESLDGLRAAGVLDKVARRHVLAQPLDPAALSDGDQLATLEGTPVPVRVTDEGVVFLGEARLGAQIGTTPAGPVYRISRVLRDHLTVRERVRAAPLLSRSASAFAAAGLDLAGPGTYFVPVDIGYDRAPGGLAPYVAPETRALARKTLEALYVPGAPLTAAQLRARGAVETRQGSVLQIAERDGLTILGQNEARILASDIRADGAIIHLIDTPLQGHLTLMERIDFLPTTKTFAALLRQAGLAATLDGPGPYTVFAPTEAGFDSLGVRGRTAVLVEEPLRALIAGFHIVPGDVPASALVNGRDLATLSEQSIRVRPDPTRGGSLVVSRARLTELLDLPAANGRLHLAASLLNPTVSPFDQLVLSGFGTFRALAERVGYRPLLEGETLFSIVGPAAVSNQFFQPGFECRARELVEDHVLPGQGTIGPRGTQFTTLSGAQLTYTFASTTFALNAGNTQIGGSRALYINSPLRNGGALHASAGRLRWYALSGPSQNLPPC